MAKAKIAAAAPQVLPFVNLEGPREPRRIVTPQDNWSEFALDDGNTLRIKPVLVDVQRLKGQSTPDGKPAYVLQLGWLVATDVPVTKKKKKKSKKAKKKKK
jgi:hypothetical protein